MFFKNPFFSIISCLQRQIPLIASPTSTLPYPCYQSPNSVRASVPPSHSSREGGGPALGSGVNPEWNHHCVQGLVPLARGVSWTLEAGLTQRLGEGLNTNTGSDCILEGAGGCLPCSQERKTGKKRSFAASGYGDRNPVVGLLSA